MATLGYINNNPGNIRLIRDSDTPFQGEIRPGNRGFRRFISMEWGYRALIKNIQSLLQSNYKWKNKYGITQSNRGDIESLIHLWAPYGDGGNNPESYANKVADHVGIPVNYPIDPSDINTLAEIAYKISEIENGLQPNRSEIVAATNLLDSIAPGSTMLPEFTVTGNKPKVIAGMIAVSAAAFALLLMFGGENEK